MKLYYMHNGIIEGLLMKLIPRPESEEGLRFEAGLICCFITAWAIFRLVMVPSAMQRCDNALRNHQ